MEIQNITLEYLTNPLYNKMNTSSTINKISKQDIKFYRKRIAALTKNMLKGDDIANASLKKIHDDYVRAAILHLKMVDTKDIIQEQYQDDNDDIPDINKMAFMNEPTSLADANEQIMRKTVNVSNLDNFVIIKNKAENEDQHYPLKKEINLKTPELKTKGIVKKNKK